MFHVVNVDFFIASHALIDFISTSNLSKYRHLHLLFTVYVLSSVINPLQDLLFPSKEKLWNENKGSDHANKVVNV